MQLQTSPLQSGGCDKDQQLTCDSGRCLDKTLVCDGTVHCRDRSDEINCPELSTCDSGTTKSGFSFINHFQSLDVQNICERPCEIVQLFLAPTWKQWCM